MTKIPTQDAIQSLNAIQKQKVAESTTEIPTQKAIHKQIGQFDEFS